MIECRCPSCQTLFPVRSSLFGDETTCPSCGHRWILDTEALAHFEFPLEIIVRLADSVGQAVRIGGITILAKRGFPLAVVQTDAEGSARITRDDYKRSRTDWESWRIMDHPGDDSLARYVTLWVEEPHPFGPERLDLEHSGKNPTVWLKEKG
jgi:hypothetical protein